MSDNSMHINAAQLSPTLGPPQEAERVSAMDAPPKAPAIVVKPFLAEVSMAGGAALQKIFTPLSQAMTAAAKAAEPYLPRADAGKIKQEFSDKIGSIKIGNDLLQGPSLIKAKIEEGQRYRTRAITCNTMAAFGLGTIGFLGGLALFKVGGSVGAGMGVVGGAVVGAVAGHLAGKYCAEYLLRGLGIKEGDPKYKNTELFVQCSFGMVGGLLGFASCAVIGGVVGAFLGEALLAGGLAKAGAGLGYFLSSATVGGYLDSVGKAYEEAGHEQIFNNDLNFDKVSPKNWANHVEKIVGEMQVVPVQAVAVEEKEASTQQAQTVHKMPSPETVDSAPVEKGPGEKEVFKLGIVGQKILSAYHLICKKAQPARDVAYNVWKNPVTATAYYAKSALIGEKKEAGPEGFLATPEKWDKWIGAESRAEKLQGYDSQADNGSLVIYAAGVSLCSLAIVGKMVVNFIGVGGGLALGSVLSAAHGPVTALCIIGGALEGAVAGGIGGYLFAKWIVGNARERKEASLVSEFRDTMVRTNPSEWLNLDSPYNEGVPSEAVKELPGFQEFKEAEMKKYDEDLLARGVENVVFAGTALFCGVIGAAVGTVGYAGLRGSMGAFVVQTAILGGSVKLGLIIAEKCIAPMLFNDMYCIGCSLEKLGASNSNIIDSLQQADSHKVFSGQGYRLVPDSNS